MNDPKRVVVIGAGPAGLTAAYELLHRGGDAVSVDVLEADPTYVGGIARTAVYKDCRFDIGGHRFFSKNDEVEDLWTTWMGDDMLVRSRLSRIYYDGEFFDYPLKIGNVLGNLGLRTSARVVASYGRKRLFPVQPEVSFADWVTNRFGRRLFTMFFESYTEKVWGIPCTTLSADWAAQRIKGLSMTTAVRDALFGKPEGEVVKTLIEQFRYPRLGPGMMWERVRDLIGELGGRVHMDRRAVGLEHDGGRVARVTARSKDGSDEASFDVDHVISSAPIARLVPALSPAAPEAVRSAANGLSYRAFLTVVLIIPATDLFPDQWIYVHDAALRVGRIQNYGNWSPHMVPDDRTSCIGLEYFCNEGDALWTSSTEELLELGAREFAALGLCSETATDGTVVRMPKAYPVYDGTYEQHVTTIRGWVEQAATNMQFVGRAGMHRYNNQDHAMMTALLAARNILGGDFDPWRVNTDAEYHETK